MSDHRNYLNKENKVIIIGVFIGSPSLDDQLQMDELEQLVNTLGGTVIDKVTQYKKNIDPKFYIGKGKLQTILNHAIESKCKYVVINNDISPGQIKNIQSFFKDKVLIKNRVGVILDIFEKHAKTKESKTQIKLAQAEYLLPRLTRQWTHLERQMGGIGTRGGPGETQIEIDRRLVRNQIIKLKKELSKISSTRKNQKKNRKNVFKVSLVGYTNAGKSTLMQKISNKKVYIKDELFATLDTNTKKININKNKHFILSDTVGFIRNLPDNLIASFRSTLGELIDSDLLLKVIDVSSIEYQLHLESIENVLNHLDISDKKYLIIFNKIDILNNESLIKNLKKLYPKSLFVSASKGLGIDLVLSRINEIINKDNIECVIKLPYNKLHLIDDLYKEFEIKNRIDDSDYIEFKISGNKDKINKIKLKLKK